MKSQFSKNRLVIDLLAMPSFSEIDPLLFKNLKFRTPSNFKFQISYNSRTEMSQIMFLTLLTNLDYPKEKILCAQKNFLLPKIIYFSKKKKNPYICLKNQFFTQRKNFLYFFLLYIFYNFLNEENSYTCLKKNFSKRKNNFSMRKKNSSKLIN